MERERNMSVEGARDLLRAFLVGQATRLEVARRADLWASTAHLEEEDWPDGVLDALTELLPRQPFDAARRPGRCGWRWRRSISAPSRPR